MATIWIGLPIMATPITNKRFASQPVSQPINWTVLANTVDSDAIRCLIDALTTADKTVALDIEHYLVKSGSDALPMVLNGLASQHPVQQATCAMVLLRWQAAAAVSQWKNDYPQHQWIANTLLDMMADATLTHQKRSLAIV
jgi:hypothetical protein